MGESIYRSAPFRWWLWANWRFPGQLKWWDKCHPSLLYAIMMNNWWRGVRSLRHSLRESLSYSVRAKTNGGRGIIDPVRQFRYAGSFLHNKSTTTPILYIWKKRCSRLFASWILLKPPSKPESLPNERQAERRVAVHKAVYFVSRKPSTKTCIKSWGNVFVERGGKEWKFSDVCIVYYIFLFSFK